MQEDPSRPLVIHGVQKILHPPARLPAWPDGQRGTRLVLITLDMPEDYVRRLFAAFTNRPSIDTPDRAALEDNPLAIAGLIAPYTDRQGSELRARRARPESDGRRTTAAVSTRLVAAVGAEGRNVDDRQRIGGFEPQPAARLHRRPGAFAPSAPAAGSSAP